jgi:predicted RNase H-related nuclease YkuK (DUF458 family)
MLERKWHRLNGKRVDDLVGEIMTADFGFGSDKQIVIGTDSQAHQKHEFVTCVVLISPGYGGKIFYTKRTENKKYSLQEKLFTEAFMSMELAMELSGKMPKSWNIEVHLDVNSNVKFKSYKYMKQLSGMVEAQGFDVKTKPDSWAATHVSEHLVKHRHEGR